MKQNTSELEQHALRIKNMLELFYGRTLPDWAIDAIVSYSTQLHSALFGPEPKRGPAQILQFTRKGRKR